MSAQSVEEVAERFGLPEWVQMHVGEHRCVDGRMYRASCLVTDSSCHKVAVSYMELQKRRAKELSGAR